MLGRCTTGPEETTITFLECTCPEVVKKSISQKRWAGQDSNLRSPFGRQIYSLVVLAAHPPTLAHPRALTLLENNPRSRIVERADQGTMLSVLRGDRQPILWVEIVAFV